MIIEAHLRFAWWWRWVYWPLTRAGLWLGVPIDPDIVVADFRRAVRIIYRRV